MYDPVASPPDPEPEVEPEVEDDEEAFWADDDEADDETSPLEGPRTECVHAVSVSLFIRSGAPTPRTASPLRRI